MANLPQTPGNVAGVSSISKAAKTGGATITAGMAVYEDSGDNYEVKAAQANSADTDKVAGILMGNLSDGQPGFVQNGGVINLGATLTVGETYVLSATVAGAIAPIGDLGSGHYVTILGVAITTANLQLGIINSGVAKP